jgi:hypothetical protein
VIGVEKVPAMLPLVVWAEKPPLPQLEQLKSMFPFAEEKLAPVTLRLVA